MRGYNTSNGMRYIEFEINDVKYRAEMSDIVEYSIDQEMIGYSGAVTVEGALMPEPPGGAEFLITLRVRDFTVTGDGFASPGLVGTSNKGKDLSDDKRIKPPKGGTR